MNIRILFVLLFALASSACLRNHWTGQQSTYLKVEKTEKEDSLVLTQISPYKKQLDSEMNKVIGIAAKSLHIGQPESTLGNWAADMVAAMAEKYTKQKPDLAVLNYGGLRIPALPVGEIKKGNVFELMPFDNMVVVVELSGADLELFLEHILAKGGWPISKGVIIKSNAEAKLLFASIHGQALSKDRTYKVATIDYLANGGDNCVFLVGKPRLETGQFLRSLAIEYIEGLRSAGNELNAEIEGRIIVE